MKNEKYLKWLRQQECFICKAPHSEPHHVARAGTAKRNFDELCCPVCRSCHDYLHAHPKEVDRDALVRVAEMYYKEYLNENS